MADGWKRRALRVGFGIVLALEVLGMLLGGSAKFTAAAWWSARFTEWGYPDGFSYVIGGIEMLAAVLLLVPAWAAYAASVLIVVMVSALITVLVHPGDPTADGPIVHLVLLAIILAVRWQRRWRPGGSDPTG